METPEKVRENRIRRAVIRRGYRFTKSRLRDAAAVGYGRIRIETDDGQEAPDFVSADSLGLTLDEIEDRLGGKGWGVYRLRAADRTLLYVGSSDQPAARWSALSFNAWWADVKYREVTWYPTEYAARAAEAKAVVTEKPLHNVRLRSSDLTETVTMKVTPQELADLDAARGPVSRSEWLRRILLGAEPRLSGKYSAATLPREAAAGCQQGGASGGIPVIADERVPPGVIALTGRGPDGKPAMSVARIVTGPPPDPAHPELPDCPHRLPPGAWCKTCGHTKT